MSIKNLVQTIIDNGHRKASTKYLYRRDEIKWRQWLMVIDYEKYKHIGKLAIITVIDTTLEPVLSTGKTISQIKAEIAESKAAWTEAHPEEARIKEEEEQKCRDLNDNLREAEEQERAEQERAEQEQQEHGAAAQPAVLEDWSEYF